jgi:hypothetical protein
MTSCPSHGPITTRRTLRGEKWSLIYCLVLSIVSNCLLEDLRYVQIVEKTKATIRNGFEIENQRDYLYHIEIH